MEISIIMHICKTLQYLDHKIPYIPFRESNLPFSYDIIQITLLKSKISCHFRTGQIQENN
jgi:hypothetical protein